MTNPDLDVPSETAPTWSHSRIRSRSSSRDLSRSRSGSQKSSRSYSRSRSRSCSRSESHRRRKQFSRSSSRSISRGSRSYSRSYSRSSSRSRDGRHRRKTSSPYSRSRSCSKDNSSPSVVLAETKKDPRDRSKRDRWENAVWKVGEKMKDLIFHLCDICDKPIVIYGRVMPCKHVFCFSCASKLSGRCHTCKKPVGSLDLHIFGGIFMCFEDKRTYLSQRDLQAHMDHRHKPRAATKVAAANPPASSSSTVPATIDVTKSAIPSALPQPPSAPIPTLFQPVRTPQQSQQQQNQPVSLPSGPQQTAILFNQANPFILSSGSPVPTFQPSMPPPGLTGVPPPQPLQTAQRALLPGGVPQSSTVTMAALAASIQANVGGLGGLSQVVPPLCSLVRTIHPLSCQSSNLWPNIPSMTYSHSQNQQNQGTPPM